MTKTLEEIHTKKIYQELCYDLVEVLKALKRKRANGNEHKYFRRSQDGNNN